MGTLANGTQSGRTDYETPSWFVRAVENRIGVQFDLDVCAVARTAKAPVYLGPDHPIVVRRNALAEDIRWSDYGSVGWMNPPYGRGIRSWLGRAAMETQRGMTMVGLPPDNAWDQSYWHDSVLHCARYLIPVCGRMRFYLDDVRQDRPATGNVVVVWTPGPVLAPPQVLEPIVLLRRPDGSQYVADVHAQGVGIREKRGELEAATP